MQRMSGVNLSMMINVKKRGGFKDRPLSVTTNLCQLCQFGCNDFLVISNVSLTTTLSSSSNILKFKGINKDVISQMIVSFEYGFSGMNNHIE